MKQTLVRDPAGASDLSVARPESGATRRKLGVPIALQLAAMIGIGALVYSSAADWFSRLGHDSEISGYTSAVEQIDHPEREAKLATAREYNAHMPPGVLRDPYSGRASDDEQDAAYLAYEQVLRVSDNGVMGQLSYPRLDIGLPLYHGTNDSVLRKGIGHLYGSSLPIGGSHTHSVLTSHSGLLNASLFTSLPDARLGDTFSINVLGETHYYEVDQIETVLPEQTEGLRIVDGKDYVTLITCTPIGINSHRMLVRGVRVPGPESAGGSVIAGDGRVAGFPWWAVALVGGSGAVAYLLFAPSRAARGARGGSHSAESRAAD